MFSEYGLIRARVLVECRWLQHLASMPQVQEVPALEASAQQLLEQLCCSFSVQDAQEVKDVSPCKPPPRCCWHGCARGWRAVHWCMCCWAAGGTAAGIHLVLRHDERFAEHAHEHCL